MYDKLFTNKSGGVSVLGVVNTFQYHLVTLGNITVAYQLVYSNFSNDNIQAALSLLEYSWSAES